MFIWFLQVLLELIFCRAQIRTGVARFKVWSDRPLHYTAGLQARNHDLAQHLLDPLTVCYVMTCYTVYSFSVWAMSI